MQTTARRQRPGKGMLTSILIAAAVFWISISVGIWAGRRHVLNSPPPGPPATAPAPSGGSAADQLQPGDRIEIRLTDASGPHVASQQALTVDADGMVTVPITGRIRAQYLTPAQLEEAIAKTYKDRNLMGGQVRVVRLPAATSAPTAR